MTKTPEIPEIENSYTKAIKDYRACKRELDECHLDIEVARMLKDMDALRIGMHKENALLVKVDAAREKVQTAMYDLKIMKGMTRGRQEEKPKEGIIQKIIKIVNPG